jgi:hypothetical protein
MFLFLTGCAGINYMKTYAGENLQEKDVAFLVREDGRVNIYSFDGREIFGRCIQSPSGLLKYFEMLPGAHEIKVRLGGAGGGFSSEGGLFEIKFDALSGHTYTLASNINTESSTWNPSVVDITAELKTAKREIGESIDGEFAAYRQNPVQPVPDFKYLNQYRQRPSQPLMIPENAVLINDYEFEFSADNEGTYHPLNTLFFRLTPGKHEIKVRAGDENSGSGGTTTFMADDKHIYELVPSGGSFYAPKVIDVTDKMDDVKEIMTEAINNFIKY